ncbi:MAG: glucokinase [Candidatus Acidiferrales bacterium]
MLIAGDLGGTKSNLGAFELQQGKLVPRARKRVASHEYRKAEDLVADFTRGVNGRVTAACFAIAGPVVNNTVRATNLPWVVEGAGLARVLGVPRVRLLNDLEATGYGIGVLEPSEIETLHAGVPNPQATKAVIAAGTGLGEAILFWDGARHLPMATEAGHSDFAPRNEKEIELWRFLKARNDFVSIELILSGRGFLSIHELLGPGVTHRGFEDTEMDPAPIITQQALAKSCPVCVATLDMWVAMYGAEAGNLALRSVAQGGIYVAGGIAIKVLPKLLDGRFAAAFVAKEKLGSFLERIPIYVVLNEDAPLLGAAHVASLAQ